MKKLLKQNKLDWQSYLVFFVLGIALVALGFSLNSLFIVNKNTNIQAQSTIKSSSIKLPANIQSSAPIFFKSFEEEVEYYKKNAKNPNNLDIEKAVRNMDKNLDGQCDACGMAILHCIESGMEDM